MQSGIPHAVLKNGVPADLCGAQAKNDPEPCRTPRQECTKHCSCDLKTKPGERCPTPPMPNGCCRMHGGPVPVGAGSPRFKDGSHSKYRAVFSGEALEHYNAAREDPRYIELREEIALFDTLIVQELMAARVGEGAALWQELGTLWQQFQNAEPTKDATAAGRALRKMGELIHEGVGRHAAQETAVELVERKRRLSETERRRLLDEQQTITQAKAIAFAGAIVAIVNRHVPERERRAAIAADVAGLIHQDVSGGAGGAFSPV